jgi:hypothetical protein
MDQSLTGLTLCAALKARHVVERLRLLTLDRKIARPPSTPVDAPGGRRVQKHI